MFVFDPEGQTFIADVVSSTCDPGGVEHAFGFLVVYKRFDHFVIMLSK